MEKEELEKFEQLKKQIKTKKTLPDEIIHKINNIVFENILIANITVLYFYFINLGFLNIERGVFITDLKVFSVSLVVLTIILFELSYKKGGSKLCFHGIETLIIALSTLFSIYICIRIEQNFMLIISLISFAFAIYYVARSIIIYNKMKKEYIKSTSDIQQILSNNDLDNKTRRTEEKKKDSKKQNKDIKNSKNKKK